MNIPKHVIDKKINAKNYKIKCEMYSKTKNLQQSHHLNLKQLKIYILGKFQCTSLISFSFDDA
jgi:hypothetical protein